MSQYPPVVIMMAGPNGAGKSTIAPRLLPDRLGVVEYVNADVIARGLSGFNSEAAAIAAGEIMLHRLRELALNGGSFAFETTGASRTFAPWIKDLRSAGYQFLLFYVWVKEPEISLERITTRVSLGGHFVPEETVRRRYVRGISNFFELYRPLADQWKFYDNSAGDGIVIAEGQLETSLTVHGANQWSQVQQLAEENRKKK